MIDNVSTGKGVDERDRIENINDQTLDKQTIKTGAMQVPEKNPNLHAGGNQGPNQGLTSQAIGASYHNHAGIVMADSTLWLSGNSSFFWPIRPEARRLN